MDESASIPLNDTAMVVDLTKMDDRSEEISYKPKHEKQEVPMYIISDDEWLRSLPENERSWYERNLTTIEEIETRIIVCTACFKQTNHKKFGEISRHPILNVPLCKNCKNFYFDGAWTKDEEGSFEFCGWCAQGGELLLCAEKNCPNTFCTRCIKRNLGRSELTKIENCDDWKCFECKPKQIKEQRALYYSLHKYWQSIIRNEEGRKGRLQKLRTKATSKKTRKLNPIQIIPLENETSDNSGSHVKKFYDNKSDISSEENKSSTISECLAYAKEVSDIFSHGIKTEKEKWKKHRNAEPESDEDVVWKHAKRVAKMIAIQNQNLDHLVQLIGESVAKKCPNHNVKQLEEIANISPGAVNSSSSTSKDATSKDGLPMLSGSKTIQSSIEFEEEEKMSPKKCKTQPNLLPSEEFKLTLRKDLFDERLSETIISANNIDPLVTKNRSNTSSMELSIYDKNKDSPIPTNKDSKLPPMAESVPLTLDDVKDDGGIDDSLQSKSDLF